MSKRKYKYGYSFPDIYECIIWINAGYPVYFRHKFMAAGFIEHWSLAQLKNAVKHNHIKTAIKIINKQEG